MKYLFLILLFFYCATTLTQDGIKYCIHEGKKVNTSLIDTSIYNGIFHEFRIEEGNGLTFIYLNNPQNLSSVDIEIFMFEIPLNKSNTFFLEKNNLIRSKALYFPMSGNQREFPDSAYFSISKGFIKGKKINDKTWYIIIDVKIKSNNGDYFSFFVEHVFCMCDRIEFFDKFYAPHTRRRMIKK